MDVKENGGADGGGEDTGGSDVPEIELIIKVGFLEGESFLEKGNDEQQVIYFDSPFSQASTIDGRRKGACLFCQEYFMDLYLLAELKTISLKGLLIN